MSLNVELPREFCLWKATIVLRLVNLLKFHPIKGRGIMK